MENTYKVWRYKRGSIKLDFFAFLNCLNTLGWAKCRNHHWAVVLLSSFTTRYDMTFFFIV